jgi:hypothetical protein
MIIVLNSEIIRKNLSSYLRETTLVWHIFELFDVFRRILSYDENVNEWIQTLINWFKTQTITVTANLLKERYIMRNVEKNRELRKYAQTVIRWVKFVEMINFFNQLNIVYNDIDSELRRDLKKSFKDITVDDYLQLLNDCKDVWWFLAARDYFTNFSRNTDKSFQFNSIFRFYENRFDFFFNQFTFYNWDQQRNQTNTYQSRSYWNQYQNQNSQRQLNRYQEFSQSQSNQQNSRTQLNDLRNSSKTLMSSPSENFQRKSQQTNRWQNKLIFDQNKQSSRTNYQNKSQNAYFDDYNTEFEDS